MLSAAPLCMPARQRPSADAATLCPTASRPCCCLSFACCRDTPPPHHGHLAANGTLPLNGTALNATAAAAMNATAAAGAAGHATRQLLQAWR